MLLTRTTAAVSVAVPLMERVFPVVVVVKMMREGRGKIKRRRIRDHHCSAPLEVGNRPQENNPVCSNLRDRTHSKVGKGKRNRLTFLKRKKRCLQRVCMETRELPLHSILLDC